MDFKCNFLSAVKSIRNTYGNEICQNFKTFL